MKRLRRIADSITFRLALVYTLVFGLSVGGLFYFLFLKTVIFATQQVEAQIDTDVASFSDSYLNNGILGLITSIRRRSDVNTNRDGVYLLVDELGQPLAGNLTGWPTKVETHDVWLNFTISDMRAATAETADVRAKVNWIQQGNNLAKYRLLVGRDVRSVNQFRQRLLGSLNIGLALTLALGVLGGFLFSRTLVRRVESITRTCRQIMSGDLTKRVPVSKRQDELTELSSNINAMLDQIERLMHGLQQVSDNIAHDLRTPLTRLRSRLEDLLRHLHDAGQRETIEAALEDAESLLSTFASLLRIARAEAGVQGNFVDIDLHAIAEDVADLYGPLAEEKGLSFVTHLEEGLTTRGDPNLVAQALANVVDNAIKYTSEGSVTVALTTLNGRPAFIVADTGPGVPDEYKGRVLERLFRMEQSRTSQGSGLGLSLVAAVARSHNMELKLEDNTPGLRVTLRFPNRAGEQPTKSKGPRLLPGPEKSDKPAPPAAAAA